LTVKEIKDPAKEKEGLHSMAAEFGYSLVPIDNGDDDDKSRDSLMMLVHESGTKPFGDEFKSPDQVQEFLEKVANGEIDAGDDEDGINVIDDVAFDRLLHDLPEVRHAEAIKRREAGEAVAAIAKSYGIKPKRRIAPPTKSKMKKALGDHHDAPKITSLVDHPDGAPGAPRTTQQDQRLQRAIDDLISLQQSPMWKKLPETERRRLSANLSDQLNKDQAAIDAKHGVTETPADWAELARREEQRQKREWAVPNHIFTRTSRRSNFDGASTIDEVRGVQKELLGEDANFIRPDDGPAYAAPKAPSVPAIIQTRRQAAQRGHGAAAADALAIIKREAKQRRLAEIGPQIKAAIEAKDFHEAGKLLAEVKTRLLDPGQFTPWLEQMASMNEPLAAAWSVTMIKTDTSLRQDVALYQNHGNF
jgi:hypothetical protein